MWINDPPDFKPGASRLFLSRSSWPDLVPIGTSLEKELNYGASAPSKLHTFELRSLLEVCAMPFGHATPFAHALANSSFTRRDCLWLTSGKPRQFLQQSCSSLRVSAERETLRSAKLGDRSLAALFGKTALAHTVGRPEPRKWLWKPTPYSLSHRNGLAPQDRTASPVFYSITK